MTRATTLLDVTARARSEFSSGFDAMIQNESGRMDFAEGDICLFVTSSTLVASVTRLAGCCTTKGVKAVRLEVVIFVDVGRPDIGTMAIGAVADVAAFGVVCQDGERRNTWTPDKIAANGPAVTHVAEDVCFGGCFAVSLYPMGIVGEREVAFASESRVTLTTLFPF